MATEACFDMGDCKTGLGSAESSAKRARRVALHDDQSRPIKGCTNRARDVANVELRVGPTGADEFDSRHCWHAVIDGPKLRMLSGEDEARADSAMEERFG